MQVTLLWTAVIVSAITFAVHTFIGGPRVAAPLLANNDLPKASKWLNYFCWHMVTMYNFTIGGAYAYVALHPTKLELVFFLTVLNSGFAILSAAVAVKGKIHPLRFPSTSLFCILSILGIFSLILG
jgi:hypothetical protein